MMAIAGDFTISAALGPHSINPRPRCSFPPSKVDFGSFPNGGPLHLEAIPKCSHSVADARSFRCHAKRSTGIFGEHKLSSTTMGQELDYFLQNAISMNFFERLNLAWKIIFPSPSPWRNSNANIAKQRLKMILFSDRCAVSEEAKQKIVSNIVSALSDFVEIESQDKVQLSVSTDLDLGTIYSVTVPVRRVRPEYQEEDPSGKIMNIKYRETGETSSSVDVKFDFYIPNEKFNDFSA